jgi:hypothetical protein
MSRGNDSRIAGGRDQTTSRRAGRSAGEARTSRSSVRMTPERARAIQAHADRTGVNQDFKARAMSAADHNEVELDDDSDG